MKKSVICALFCFVGLVSANLNIPIHIQVAEAPYFLVMDMDHTPFPTVPNFPDKDVKAIKMDIFLRGAPGEIVTYSFHKCGVMIFNSTTSADSEHAFTFDNEWIGLFLNGTNKCVTNGRRKWVKRNMTKKAKKPLNFRLVIFVESTVPLEGSFSFEKQLIPDYSEKTSLLTVVDVHFDGKVRKMVPLEGILKIQGNLNNPSRKNLSKVSDEFSEHFPINISCSTELIFEIGVCNSTFLRIEETGPFNRPFTPTEIRILALMRSVHCDTWKSDV